jgi:hypothetical protein
MYACLTPASAAYVPRVWRCTPRQPVQDGTLWQRKVKRVFMKHAEGVLILKRAARRDIFWGGEERNFYYKKEDRYW